MTMHPTIEATWRVIEAAAAGMSAEQMSKSPAEGKWCAAEVAEHLLITYTATTGGLRKALAKGAPLATKPTLKQRLFQLVVLDIGYFPTGRKAPVMTLPKGLDPAKVVPAVEQALEDMDRTITECEQKFGPRKIADHPVLGALTANEWRKFHLAHARHHAPQIQRLKAASA
jgi:hypothetical protein